MTIPDWQWKFAAPGGAWVPIAAGQEARKKDIKISLYGLRSHARTRARSKRYLQRRHPDGKTRGRKRHRGGDGRRQGAGGAVAFGVARGGERMPPLPLVQERHAGGAGRR